MPPPPASASLSLPPGSIAHLVGSRRPGDHKQMKRRLESRAEEATKGYTAECEMEQREREKALCVCSVWWQWE